MKQTQKARMIRRPTLFFLGGTFVLLLVCVTTIFVQSQQSQATHAADLSFAGSPTLPASTVDSILMRLGSPMVGVGKVVEQASREYNIDDAFALSVWDIETGDGAAGVGRTYMNPGGVRGSGAYPIGLGGYTIYPSYTAGVRDWFSIVKSRYANRGLSTVYTLCVPYVGTNNAYNWAAKVSNLMYRYRGEAPPPEPTPTMAPPTPTAVPVTPTSIATVSPSVTVQALHMQGVAQGQGKMTTILASGGQDQPQSSSLTQQSPFILGTILLVAMGVALSALLVGGRKVVLPVGEPEKKWHYDPITPMPAIYVNEYSPLQELDTAPQIVVASASSNFAAGNFAISNPVTPLWLPTQAIVGAGSMVNPEFVPTRAGLLKRYRLTEQLEQGPVSAFTGTAETYTGSLESEIQPAPITEDLFYRQPFASVPQYQGELELVVAPEPVVLPSYAKGNLLRPRKLVLLSDDKSRR